jgi:hypothetical protein
VLVVLVALSCSFVVVMVSPTVSVAFFPRHNLPSIGRRSILIHFDIVMSCIWSPCPSRVPAARPPLLLRCCPALSCGSWDEAGRGAGCARGYP